MTHRTIMILAAGLLAWSNTPMAQSPGDPLKGAEKWAENCARCHNMRNPGEFEARRWQPIVTHMRVRAGLPGQDARDILAFLQGSAADANRTIRLTPVAQTDVPPPPPSGQAGGEAVYATTCIACHGANGEGVLPGMPDFRSSDSPLWSKADDVLLENMLNGIQSEGSPMAMPPKGGNPALTAEDLRRALAYMKTAFEN